MGCDYCAQKVEENISNEDCVLYSLEKIKNHYIFFKNAIKKRDEQLTQLQLRNDKLLSAVELLQKEKGRMAVGSPSKPRSPRKRRKANVQPSVEIDLSCVDDNPEEEATAQDKALDDLNVALNSQQLLDCSSADCSIAATQWTPPHDEIIEETEMVKSPRKLHSSFELKRRLNKHNNSSDENQTPNSNLVRIKTDSWMEKGKKPQLDLRKSPSVGVSSRFGRNESFIKPMPLPKVEKNLSLKKSVKLKQTRLQLDVLREKSTGDGSDVTFCEAIGDSPNAPKNKQTKPARSWLLRTNSTGINSSHKDDQGNHADSSVIKFNSSDDEFFENVFKFAQDTTATKVTLNKMPSPKSRPTEFVLREAASSPEKPTTSVNADAAKNQPDMESVIILTPETQDIIFLDDTCNNTNIESMELMQDLLKCDDKGLENLKRIENEKIKKLQKTALADSAPGSKPQTTTSKLSLNTLATTSKTAISAKIKQEKKTQIFNLTKDPQTATVSKNNLLKNSEDSPDLMPKPFVVKEENLGLPDVMPKPFVTKQEDKIKTTNPAKKLSIKEKFDIDCFDCQQYIDFLGAGMSDKQIIAHLERCSRHKQLNVPHNETPDGFWNPFIPTFDENDPRNETLIETRPCDKRKNKIDFCK